SVITAMAGFDLPPPRPPQGRNPFGAGKSSLGAAMNRQPRLPARRPRAIWGVAASRRDELCEGSKYFPGAMRLPRWCHAWREMASPTQNGHVSLGPYGDLRQA